MKTLLILGFLAILGLASAQGLPTCAHNCVNGAIQSTGCKGVDVSPVNRLYLTAGRLLLYCTALSRGYCTLYCPSLHFCGSSTNRKICKGDLLGSGSDATIVSGAFGSSKSGQSK
jgi:hypothetical protein